MYTQSRGWRIREVFFHSDTELLQIVIGFYTLVFGLWILLPPPFVVNSTVLSMGRFAPLQLWGTAMVIFGIVRLAAALTECVVPVGVSQFAHLAKFLIWVFVFTWGAISNFTATPVNIPAIIPLNGLMALASGWLFLRCGWDHKRFEAACLK